MTDSEKIFELAQELLDELVGDIELSRTREEHIRMTARANKTSQLLGLIRSDSDLTDS